MQSDPEMLGSNLFWLLCGQMTKYRVPQDSETGAVGTLMVILSELFRNSSASFPAIVNCRPQGPGESMPNMTGRPGYRTMEMIGGSSEPYLARTPCVPLRVCTLFHRGGNRRGFTLQGESGDHFHCTVDPSPGHIRCREKPSVLLSQGWMLERLGLRGTMHYSPSLWQSHPWGIRWPSINLRIVQHILR